ncbi:hypothetical protein AWZ03_010924 [Drosophila navojoa]|uniref:Uncharacterized protein n=1 Tax=Drosophila navojoa TaxID=7232 RepID=A0A484B1C5_DRONA|nr:hypothetical protein AWZ03_010924 [Drosophila navojoa]
MNDEKETEKERTLPTQTSPAKVLFIGDPAESVSPNKPERGDIKRNFKENCTNYLSLILMGNPTPMEVANGEYPIEWVGMEVIKRENKPTLYQFICLSAQTKPKNVKLENFYQTINANAIMRDVRQFLKKERWISKFVITGPLRDKGIEWFYNSDESYLMNAVYKAAWAEKLKGSDVILPYLLYLHRQHVQNNPRR